MSREALWAEMMTWDTDEVELRVDRERRQPGRSFSEAAMEQLHDEMLVFVGTRVMRRWDSTAEPPTLLRVELRVTVA